MIASIKKNNVLSPILDYHLSKKEGQCEQLANTTFAESREDILKTFEETVSLKPDLKENIFVHISLSLSPNENLSNQKFTEVAEEYLTKMGYGNCPYLIYRHREEGKKEHVHILTSRVDYDGKVVSDSRDFQRSEKLSRQLETKFGLVETKTLDKGQKNLNEINAKKFSISNALTKCMASSRAVDLKEFGSLSDKINTWTKSRIPDNEMLGSLQSNVDKKEYAKLCDYLKKEGLVYIPLKDKLVNDLEFAHKQSKNKEQFLDKLEQYGIYYRLLFLKGKPHIEYGNKDQSFYAQEKQLPPKFRLENIERYFEKQEKQEQFKINKIVLHDKKQQRQFVRNSVTRALRASGSLEQLKERLKFKEVSLITHSNASGIYGVSFKGNLEGSIQFKASEVDRHLSYASLMQQLAQNKNKGIGQNIGKQINTLDTQLDVAKGEAKTTLPNIGKLGKAIDSSEDPEIAKKRNKKDEEKDEGMSM